MAVLIFILILLVLVVGHEAGHFVAAKLARMKVLEFGVGFPPRIWGRRVGETEYTVNWIPFGGFVRILGEDEKDADDPDAFSRKHPVEQAFVLAAGPGANILFGIMLSIVALVAGMPSIIDGTDDVARARDLSVIVSEVIPESPAADAGVRAGDRVLSIMTPEALAQMVAESDGPVTLRVRRGGEEFSVLMTPEPGIVSDDPDRKAVGVATALIGTISLPLNEAVVVGTLNAMQNLVAIAVAILTLIGNAVSLSADLSQVAGPVGIAALTGEAATFGLGSLLSFAAMLSLNLAIINLLPFPALDGGRLFFLGIETAVRRRLPAAVFQTANAVGFVLLILLMLAVTVQDISRLIG